jgi:hypothetical protein
MLIELGDRTKTQISIQLKQLQVRQVIAHHTSVDNSIESQIVCASLQLPTEAGTNLLTMKG